MRLVYSKYSIGLRLIAVNKGRVESASFDHFLRKFAKQTRDDVNKSITYIKRKR